MLGGMELGANQDALKNLLGALYKLMANKKYGEDTPMSPGDMSDVMEEAKDSAMEDEAMEESPVAKEARDFMKGSNRGNIPKATAVMIKAKMSKPAKKSNPGYHGGKKGKGKKGKGKGKSLFGR